MKPARLVAGVLIVASATVLASASGCGGKSAGGGNASGDDGGGGTSSGCYTGFCGGSSGGSTGGNSSGFSSDANFGGVVYNSTNCMSGRTTISGKVYDPAGVNPLYAVTVYIPGMGQQLPMFVNGPNNCEPCGSLYPQTVAASAITDAAGYFQIQPQNMANVPDGPGLPLVVQVGKWRKVYKINVTPCRDNPLPDKMLTLPKNHMEGDIPNIAISTGAADSLECLLLRMGVSASEFTGGPQGAGRLHIFTGYNGASVNGGGSPDPNIRLWDTVTDLNLFDVVLLSCEGQETTFANKAGDQMNLWNYTSMGGRVFASHFHYAWFDTGPFATNVSPALASWATGVGMDSDPIYGKIATTTPSGMPFPEGANLNKWLGNVGALTNGELLIHYAKHNATVTPTNTPSTPWISADMGSQFPGGTEYFSFDTPPASTDKCGRVVYSDLHVSGGPGAGANPDYPAFNPGIVPDQCASHPLTPQEKALEFMIFDLSSCLIPIGQNGMPPPVQ
jgi:hypothetical protein